MSELRRRARTLAHRGFRVQCPCCGAYWRRFAWFHNRSDAVCLRCGSLERHRALRLLIEQRRWLDPLPSTLHFAPEHCLAKPFREAPGNRYTTADLKRKDVDVRADITDLPFASGTFDLVVCNHVLEHVRDEASALTELRRVVAPAGHVVITVPQEPWREQTYENPTATDAAAREQHFGQDDHVRAYGSDLEDHLKATGFEVEVVEVELIAGTKAARRHGLRSGERIYVCTCGPETELSLSGSGGWNQIGSVPRVVKRQVE